MSGWLMRPGCVWEGPKKPPHKVSHGERGWARGEERLYGAGKGRARQCKAADWGRWEREQG